MLQNLLFEAIICGLYLKNKALLHPGSQICQREVQVSGRTACCDYEQHITLGCFIEAVEDGFLPNAVCSYRMKVINTDNRQSARMLQNLRRKVMSAQQGQIER